MKMLRWLLCLALLVTPAAARFPHGAISSTGVLPSGFSTLTIGGGGFVRGLDINGTTMLAATDTAGGYKLNTGTGLWEQLFTTSSMSGAVIDFAQGGGSGAYGLASAPSNPSRIYTMRNNVLWTSTNGGTTFSVCAGWAATAGQGNPNDPHRLSNPKLVIDPANEQIMIVSTQNAGAWYTTNACTTMVLVPSPVPATDAAGYLFAFDSSGGTSTTPTRTNNVYVASQSAKTIFKSTTGVTGTFASTSFSSAVNELEQIAVASSGIILVSDGEANKLFRYNRASSAAWDTITNTNLSGNVLQGIAVDPTNTARVLVVDTAGLSLSVTSDITVVTPTWGISVNPTGKSPQADVPWLGFTTNNSMTIGNALFDSTGTNAYVGAGIGVFKINPNSQTTWVSQTRGIENLTSNVILSPPWNTGHPIWCGWDRMLMYITPGTYPAQNQVNTDFNACWDAEYSITGNTIVANIAQNNQESGYADSGYSIDGGKSYTLFPTTPSASSALTTSSSTATQTVVHFGAGNIPPNASLGDSIFDNNANVFAVDTTISALNSPSAGDITLTKALTGTVQIGDSIQMNKFFGIAIRASTATNFIWLPGQRGGISPFVVDLYFTTNTGTAWSKSNIVGGNPGIAWSVEADKNVVNQFWAYNGDNGKVYKSTDSGANYNAIVGQTPANLATSVWGLDHGANIYSVPGQPGHLFMIGNNGGTLTMIRSTDNGVNWNTVTNCQHPSAFGFGKVATGHTYPTLFAVGCSAGFFNNEIWSSVDGDQTTPTFQPVGGTAILSTPPWLDEIVSIAGDWNIEGQFYFAYSGSSTAGFHP